MYDFKRAKWYTAPCPYWKISQEGLTNGQHLQSIVRFSVNFHMYSVDDNAAVFLQWGFVSYIATAISGVRKI